MLADVCTRVNPSVRVERWALRGEAHVALTVNLTPEVKWGGVLENAVKYEILTISSSAVSGETCKDRAADCMER
jgi:hypothetical protein